MDLAQLTLMANQIARNFAVQGEERAAAATAEHIELFWESRMTSAIVDADSDDFSPIVRKAINLLKKPTTQK